MNVNMTVGHSACQLLCRYTQSTLAASCVCWIVPTVTCHYQNTQRYDTTVHNCKTTRL